jgi:pimeloyl-ACP methyl ester carboxylesterase
MAAWVYEWMATDIAADCARITAPTLVITGDSRLDRVVSVSSSLEYLTLIRGARHATLPGTGHVGLMAKPREFAALVDRFLGLPPPEDSDLRAKKPPIRARPVECG